MSLILPDDINDDGIVLTSSQHTEVLDLLSDEVKWLTNDNTLYIAPQVVLLSYDEESEKSKAENKVAEFEFDADLGYCRPGNFCEFNVSLTNAGDVSDTFSITSDIILIRNGWSFGLSWNQETQIYAQSGETIAVRMSVDIPLNSIAGQFSSILLTATSDARPDISNSIRVNATAGMISNAFFSVDFSNLDSSILEPLPGSNVELPFTLWNNASTFDIYEVCFFRSGYRSWLIESESSGSIFRDGVSCENPHITNVFKHDF